MAEDKVIAVVLSGCGVYDGTEVHEAAAVCQAVTRAGYTPEFYAPDKPHVEEVNHVMQTVQRDTQRNVLHESGRIARGKDHIHDITVSQIIVFF